jgi:hypothetical protein
MIACFILVCIVYKLLPVGTEQDLFGRVHCSLLNFSPQTLQQDFRDFIDLYLPSSTALI